MLLKRHPEVLHVHGYSFTIPKYCHCVVLGVLSSLAIIFLSKRELVCFTLNVLRCLRSVSLPHGAVG